MQLYLPWPSRVGYYFCLPRRGMFTDIGCPASVAGTYSGPTRSGCIFRISTALSLPCTSVVPNMNEFCTKMRAVPWCFSSMITESTL